MTGINHKQAGRYLRAAADGLLRDNQRALLDAHLRDCDSCRAEADELKALEARLKKNFQARWDANDGPSKNVMANIHSQTRRIIMTNRINIGLKTLAGIAALLLLGLVFNFVIGKLQNSSTPAGTTQTGVPALQQSTRWIAFVSTQDGNSEIYVMNVDGSGIRNITNNPAYDGNPIWSPDGSRIAFESERDNNREIYVINLDGSGLTRLTSDPDNDVLGGEQAWPPDGSQILYRNDHNGKWDLFATRTDGSGVTQLTQASDPEQYDGLWSPDGQQIAYMDVNNKSYTIRADGSQRQSIPTPVSFLGSIYNLRWSNDGKSLYYIANVCGSGGGEACVAPIYGLYRASPGEFAPILVASSPGDFATYSLDESGVIYIQTNQFFTSNPSRISWKWHRVSSNTTIPLTEWKNMESDCKTPDAYDQVLLVDPAGPVLKELLVSVICAKDNTTHLYSVSADGAVIKPLIVAPIAGQFVYGQASLDGNFLTFTIQQDQQTAYQTYILNLEAARQNPNIRPLVLPVSNGVLQPVPFDGALSVHPLPTPATPPTEQSPLPSTKGDLIAFIRDNALYVMRKDGSQTKQLTNAPLDWAQNPRWSPDGSQILFEGSKNGIFGLYLIRPDGSGMTQLVQGGWGAVWSPDGSQIAYLAGDWNSPAESRIEIINADGSHPRTIRLDTVNGLFDPTTCVMQWSQDGKFIQFSIAKWSGGVPYSKNDAWTIYQASAQDGSLQTLIQSKVPIINWSGAASNLTYITRNEKKWQWIRGQTVITTWSDNAFGDFMVASWWSPDKHQFLFSVSGFRDLVFLANSNGTSIQPLTQIHNIDVSSGFSWSPDGRYLIFSAALDAPSNYDIYLLDIQAALRDPTTKPVKLTNSGFSEYAPTWQPQP